jgi:tetratricopeptide (TPR) repeat protein
MKRLAVAAIAILAALATLVAQEHAGHQIPSIPLELLARPIGLRDGIGIAHDPITTTSNQAQALYDQGLAHLHSYSWIAAARAFHEALRVDPSAALAHVGLSIAYEELNKPDAARDALLRATAVSSGLSDHERRHIEIRSMQLASAEARSDAARLGVYRATIDAALVAYPSDVELLLLRGVVESRDPADRGQGSTTASIAFYLRVLGADANNFAAHHYLTHALENAGRIDDALIHAEHYARLAPAVPHAHHMRGHGLRRVGRIGEAIAEFRKAFEIETARAASEVIPVEFDWHYQHNLDLLATSHQYLGLMRTAETFLEKSFAIGSPLVVQEFNKHEWPTFLLARGRAEEALASTVALTRSPASVVRAIGHVLAGRAQLAQRQFAAAAESSNVAMKELRAAGAEASLAAPYLQALQAEFFLRTGERDRAAALFRDVRAKIRTLPGPDAWSQGLFRLESIGRVAVASSAWDIAAETAADMEAHDPRYGGTHYLQALVAEHQQDPKRMKEHLRLAADAWKDGDADFADLIDIRARLRRPLH